MIILKSSLLNRITLNIVEKRMGEVADVILNFLGGERKILDIGCGFCVVAKSLSVKGYKVTPLDVKNLSIVPEITPTIYNGKKIPFQKNSFDTSLFITVLHHTPDPGSLLAEAKRVSNRIIVMEDIFTNPLQKYLTFMMDSVVNFEFFNHPHTNKSDKEWKELFCKLGLKVKKSVNYKYWWFFQSITYLLVK